MNVISSQKIQWVLDHGNISISQTAEKWSATKHLQSTKTSHLRLKTNLAIERLLRNLARFKPEMQLSITKTLEKTPNHHKLYWDFRANWRSFRSNPMQVHRQAPGPNLPLKAWQKLLKQIFFADQKPIKKGAVAIPPAVLAPLLPDALKKLYAFQNSGKWAKVSSARAWSIFRFEKESNSGSPHFWALHWNRDMVLARDIQEGGLVWLELGELIDVFDSLSPMGQMEQTFANQAYYQMPVMMGESK